MCRFFLQSLLYKRVHEAQFRSHLANEMMMYHMKVKSHLFIAQTHSRTATRSIY